MPAPTSFDYAVVRVVPRVDREEFINAGVIVFCRTRRFLRALVELDERRLAALAPYLDASIVRQHLEGIPTICEGGDSAGPIGHLPLAARFHWLVSPRSTMIQISPVHSGICADPEVALDRLFQTMVRPEFPDEVPTP